MNFEAIKKFRQKGNKFVIATGRDFKSLKRHLDFYECSYDGLICNDGGVGFDENNNVLFTHYLNEHEIKNLLYFFDTVNKKYFNKIYFYNEHGKTKNTHNIIEIVVKTAPFKNYNKLIKQINDFYPYLTCYNFDNFLCVRKKGNKSTGIKEINEILNIDKGKIYTVGDNFNDYHMIKDFNGYNVLFSNPKLHKVSSGTVLNVAQLVKKLENK